MRAARRQRNVIAMTRLASLATVVVALAAALAFHDDDVAMAAPLETVAADSLQKAVDDTARPTAIFVTGRGVTTPYGAASVYVRF